MPSAEERPAVVRARRSRLDRDRMLTGALALADRSGIEALTIRSLAADLGVKPMALYHYVTGKDEIVDGLVDLVFAEVELPPADLDWRAAVRRRAVSLRTVLGRHPWATPLMESRPRPGPATLRQHDAMLGTFRRAGFSWAAAGHAYALLDSYVYGFALTQAGLPFDTPESIADLAEAIMAGFPAGEYPHLAEFTRDLVLRPGYDYRKEFEFGLDLILDGLSRAESAGFAQRASASRTAD